MDEMFPYGNMADDEAIHLDPAPSRLLDFAQIRPDASTVPPIAEA
jgi:hypothetical protein